MPEAFSKTARLCGSVNVGSTRSGINMDAVRKMGQVIKRTAELTADTDALAARRSSSLPTPWRTTPSWPARSTAWASRSAWSTWA